MVLYEITVTMNSHNLNLLLC